MWITGRGSGKASTEGMEGSEGGWWSGVGGSTGGGGSGSGGGDGDDTGSALAVGATSVTFWTGGSASGIAPFLSGRS